jgi:hypothetical protein
MRKQKFLALRYQMLTTLLEIYSAEACSYSPSSSGVRQVLLILVHPPSDSSSTSPGVGRVTCAFLSCTILPVSRFQFATRRSSIGVDIVHENNPTDLAILAWHTQRLSHGARKSFMVLFSGAKQHREERKSSKTAVNLVAAGEEKGTPPPRVATLSRLCQHRH